MSTLVSHHPSSAMELEVYQKKVAFAYIVDKKKGDLGNTHWLVLGFWKVHSHPYLQICATMKTNFSTTFG